jgi:DNA-directed RNA polymerase specialized sigma24 family protein
MNMPPHEYQAVFLVGMCGLEFRDAAQEMGVGTMTMHRRYTRGIAWLTTYLNTGDYD